MIVQSYSGLTATRADDPKVYTGANNLDAPAFHYWYGRTYAWIYATQPAVRTCVDFLARNIAQLGLHVFRRVSDTDRVRLTDHPVAQWIQTPNPYTTRYRLIESLVGDLGIYFNGYLMKIRLPGGRIGMVRIPAGEMLVEGGLLPQTFVWTVDGQKLDFATTEIIYANGFNPLNALMGISPLETLRQTLMNESSATDYRQRYWQNASRMEGVIERPKDAPKWTPQQKQAWREQWQARYTGPSSTGQTPVLEDGMSWKALSFSARDSEYTAARKLTREEVASAYHIPLPMVGILDHATFSNIKEQHKQLYADCLGPWLKMLQEAFDLQLVSEARDSDHVYVEFNINEKLKGSFEEQSNALRLAVGRPFMTANEARARLNLPRITDDPSADELAAQQGGPASSGLAPADPTLEAPAADDVAPETPTDDPPPSEGDDQAALIVRRHQERHRARLDKLPTHRRAAAFRRDLTARWTPELAADLRTIVDGADADRIALLVNADTLAQLERDA